MTLAKTSNDLSHYWCQELTAELTRLGIDHFFIAPGSRSSPMVSAVVRNGCTQITSSIDERSLAFMALGFGKRSGRAGALIVTSGTAVGNLYPAVIEAYSSGIPMLILTADRPFELRRCGANQTIQQANIFSDHVIESIDLSPPSPEVSMVRSMAIIEQAIYSMYQQKGPVHINVQLREPLESSAIEHFGDVIVRKRRPFLDGDDSKELMELLVSEAQGFGLLVVGELPFGHGQDEILELAHRLKWPVFADITSNIRLYEHPQILSRFELALLNPDFVKMLKFDVVIKFGGRLVSKRFWSWVKQESRSYFLSLVEPPHWIDPTGRFDQAFTRDLKSFLAALTQGLKMQEISKECSSLKKRYRLIDAIIGDHLSRHLDYEGSYAARLINLIKEPSHLFLSSSMPIRDVDQFASPTKIAIAVHANRGASGIDGIISSAIGVSIGDDRPVVLLIGDIAFLHDTNGLMAIKYVDVPMLIVVLNNGCGGIFHQLPIANEKDVLSPYIDTPHQVELAFLCRAHGLDHRVVSDADGFDKAVEDFFVFKRTVVLEVKIHLENNIRSHRKIYDQISSLSL